MVEVTAAQLQSTSCESAEEITQPPCPPDARLQGSAQNMGGEGNPQHRQPCYSGLCAFAPQCGVWGCGGGGWGWECVCHCPDLTLPWILAKAAATLPSPMKSSGSLQALRAVFPDLRAVVTAFPASGPGTVLACLARAESEPRHPGDWPRDCRSVKGHLLSASPPGLCAEPRCAGTVETTQSSSDGQLPRWWEWWTGCAVSFE